MIFRLAILFWILIKSIKCDVLASSKLVSCSITNSSQINSTNGLPLESDYNCKKKLVVMMNIDNNLKSGSQFLKVQINNVTDSNGNNQTLKDSLYIWISKSESRYNYPLKYKQDFNFRPTESYVVSNMFTCSDNIYDENPDCGWVYDKSGSKIINSQGFCCSCDLLDLFGVKDSFKRASSCQAFQFSSGSATAHCLRFDPVYYSGYEPQPAVLNYTISVGFQLIQSNGTSQDYLMVSPSSKIANSDEMQSIVKIIGELKQSQELPDISGDILLKPNSTSTNSSFAYSLMNYWLLVPRDMITFDGSECNKVGIGYTAYETQGQRCDQPVNSCLANQIFDLLMSDISKVQNNLTPDYLVTASFLPSNIAFQAQTATENVYLSYLTTDTQTTLITIEMNADNLVFFHTVANGTIIKASIRTDKFDAMSGNGYIDFEIQNTDNFTSNFYVELDNCTNQILNVPSQTLSINGLAIYNSTFSVYTTNTQALNYTCTVVLKNSDGVQIDSKLVSFSTNVQQNITVDQGSNGSKLPGTPATQESSKSGCSSCSGMFALYCMLTNLCVWQTITTIIVFLIVAAIVILSCKYCRWIYKYLFCWWIYVLKWAKPTSCCCKKKKDINREENYRLTNEDKE